MKGGTELPLRRLGPGSRFEKTPFDDGAGGHDPRTLLTVRLEYSFGFLRTGEYGKYNVLSTLP